MDQDLSLRDLMVFYDQGKDVKKDAEQAQRWLDAAASVSSRPKLSICLLGRFARQVWQLLATKVLADASYDLLPSEKAVRLHYRALCGAPSHLDVVEPRALNW